MSRICSSRKEKLKSSRRSCEYSRMMSSLSSMRPSIRENSCHPAEILSMVRKPCPVSETTVDFFVKLVPYCKQIFQLSHFGPLRDPCALCQRLHVHNPILTSPSGMVQNTPSSLPSTGRAVFVGCFLWYLQQALFRRRAHITQHPFLRTGKVQRTVHDNHRVC